MENMKKRLFVMLMVVGVIGMAYSPSWGQAAWHDPIEDEWNTADLFLARPASVAAAVIGTGLFVLSLPFTIPTGGVEASADMFIAKPFQFAFERPFPDENILAESYLGRSESK